MKPLIPFFALAITLICLSSAIAGTDSIREIFTDSTQLIPYYLDADEYPVFPGGAEALARYIQDHLEYPELAYSHGHEGTVLVEFVIEKDGRIGKVKVLKKVGLGCDESAVAVFRDMPRWRPAMRKGQPIAVRCTTPVKFSLF